jgi:hypothetical protein
MVASAVIMPSKLQMKYGLVSSELPARKAKFCSRAVADLAATEILQQYVQAGLT